MQTNKQLNTQGHIKQISTQGLTLHNQAIHEVKQQPLHSNEHIKLVDPKIKEQPILEQAPVPQEEQQSSPNEHSQNINNENENEAGNEAQGENDNEQNWTDATESIAADDDDDIWVVDDDIVNAMEDDSGEEQDPEQQQHQEEPNEQSKKVEEVDLEDLENQFVKGGQSNEDWRLGLHQKFCISLAVAEDGKSVFSGGGDDRLLCFRQTEGKWQQFYRVQHSQTVSKVEISHDGKYVVSLSDTQIYCTDVNKLQSRKLQVEEPADVVCHKQGGVLAAAHGYTVSIYNLKELQLFASYNLDLPASSICFSDNGKQIIAACENKLRIITPKTGEILKVSGNEFHKEQISTMATSASLVVTGCIGGQVFVSGLAKGNILGSFEPFKGAINCLTLADNYALICPQGDGVYWTDINKFKTIFHSPIGISASAIVKVHSNYHYAVADLQGVIHLLDRRAPMNLVGSVRAGNSIHALQSKGSQLFAACEDGYVRVFDVAKLL